MAQTSAITERLKALSETASLPVSGLGGIAFQITGTFVGTITFEVSLDGATFTSLLVTPSGSTTAVTTTTSTGVWTGSVVGALVARARMSAYTSGSARVDVQSVLSAPSGGGSGGGGDATAANQVLEIADLDKLAAQILDYDTGAGSASQVIVGIALPGSGGPVAGGTSTNPLVVSSRPTVASSETLSSVASSATNVTLIASNANRLGCIMFNDSTQAAYVKFGATATTSSFTYKVFPSQTLEFPWPIYQGQCDALWDSANGNMRITETA